MKSRVWLVAGMVAAMGVGVVVAQEGRQPERRQGTDAQRGAQPEQPQGQPSADEMAAWAEAMQPGAEHERLAPMVGEWNATMKFWMGGPDPVQGSGKAKNEWVLGKRFVRQNFTGNFMGQQFEGLGYSGYDKNKKKYVGSWMDNFSTSMLYDEGEWDARQEAVVYRGSFVDPMGREIKGRNVVKIVNPDKIIYTMYHTEPGAEEQKVGEITYVRAGSGGRDADADGSDDAGGHPGSR